MKIKFLVLIRKCNSYITEKYEYKDFIKLSEIKDISPNGYIVRLPIYVQGRRDALIQFSTRSNPASTASVYEFGEYQIMKFQNNELLNEYLFSAWCLG